MSFAVEKEFAFSAAHRIRGHRGGCERTHGHNYRVRVRLEASELDELGMVLDFADLKAILREVLEPFDHRTINDIPPFDRRNTTAELLAEHIFNEVARRLPAPRVRLRRVEVSESDSASAIYEPDGR